MAEQPDNKETLRTSAAQVIVGLRDFISQELATVHTRLAVVQSTSAGPPPTITVSIYGDIVPNVRYIGTTPAVGETVVLIADGPFYICIGELAS